MPPYNQPNYPPNNPPKTTTQYQPFFFHPPLAIATRPTRCGIGRGWGCPQSRPVHAPSGLPHPCVRLPIDGVPRSGGASAAPGSIIYRSPRVPTSATPSSSRAGSLSDPRGRMRPFLVAGGGGYRLNRRRGSGVIRSGLPYMSGCAPHPSH